MFEIKKFNIKLLNKYVIHNFSLKAKAGDIIAIIGPNGAGKSTLLKGIMKHPNTKSTGQIILGGKKLSNLSTDQIAQLGVYYVAQNLTPIEGLNILSLLKQIWVTKNDDNKFISNFNSNNKVAKELSLPEDYFTKYINIGLSGGQQKKSELLISQSLNPKIFLFDEIDSGLDANSLLYVQNFIKKNNKEKIFIIVSHQFEFLKKIPINKVVVLVDGKISQVGNASLLSKIDLSNKNTPIVRKSGGLCLQKK